MRMSKFLEGRQKMDEAILNISPAKWQTYVTTIKCDFIDDHVSLMVKKDWTSHCTWYREHKEPVPEGKKKIKQNKKTREQIELCQGPFCSYVIGYRDKLIKEEQETTSKST
jgi:hypothetical protein